MKGTGRWVAISGVIAIAIFIVTETVKAVAVAERMAHVDALIAGLGDVQWDGACQSSQPC
jgi:hypothetical protein